ncbi:MAG: hypothetical protein IPI57_11925 [Candidatus Competibacteraceae bacterium]|nr:hypothetical protein [Candidatus Competibacteraceae bacterium]
MAALPVPSHAARALDSTLLGNASLAPALPVPGNGGRQVSGGLGWLLIPAAGTPRPMPALAVNGGGGSVGYPH